MSDTIFALASGAPPAAIAIIRLSGPKVAEVLEGLGGSVPSSGRLLRRTLRTGAGEILDEAMVVRFAAPRTVTGEDYGEIHCHGGRAVVQAIEAALGALPGLRRAEPGEFTRRGLADGKLDLAQAEALGDLLRAETELQRRIAIGGVGGNLSRRVEEWRKRVLTLSAQVEAALDFSDEGDVAELPHHFFEEKERIAAEMRETLTAPGAEMLNDGFRVVISGPPNSGKSSLFNRIIGDEAALVSEIAGTTRDVLERRILVNGLPFVLVDTAGIRDHSDDRLELLGIGRAKLASSAADLVVWTGPPELCPEGACQLATKADLDSECSYGLRVSAKSGEGIGQLLELLGSKAEDALSTLSTFALNTRQRSLIEASCAALDGDRSTDPLLLAEELRRVRNEFDVLLGRTGTEEMLDSLFGRFCIGK